MKRILGAAAAILLTISAGGTASAQATPPSASSLLTAASVAMKAAGSAHVHAILNLNVTGLPGGTIGAPTSGPTTANGTVDGDVSWKKPPQAHFTVTLSGSGSAATSLMAPVTFTLVLANGQLALQTPDGKWTCQKMKLPNNMKKLLKKPNKVKVKSPNGLPKVKLHFTPPAVVGADTVNGVAVWHLQETGTMTMSKPAGSTQITVDIYIAQTGDTIQRVAENLTSSGSASSTSAFNGTMSVTADFTNYGETVQAQLPSACSTSSPGARTVARVLPFVQLLLMPQSVL